MNCREEMAEKQKRMIEENEQLRKRLNDVEMQLEIYQIEQETALEERCSLTAMEKFILM